MFRLTRILSHSLTFKLAALLALLPAATQTVPAANTGVAPVLVPYQVTAIAGNVTSSIGGYGGEGVPATQATLNGVNALAVDSSGDVYLADQSNAIIREINAQTGLIRTIAGVIPSKCVGTVCTVTNPGCADGVPALGSQVGARVQGLVVDGAGNLYFTDYNYQGAWVIYKGGARVANFISLVDPAGVATAGGVKAGYVYHIAGNAVPKAGGGCATGAGTADQVLATAGAFHNPLQMGIDAAGNLYIQDVANQVVRVINTQSTPQTFFGIQVMPGFIAAVVGCNKTLTVSCPAATPPFGGPANQALYSAADAGLTADQYGNVIQLDTKGTTPIYAGEAYAGGAAPANLINVESGLTANPGSFYQVINSITSPNGLPSAVQAVFANNSNSIVLRPTSVTVDPLSNIYMMDYHWISIYRIDVNNGMATRLNGTTAVAGTKLVPVPCAANSAFSSTDNYGDGCPISQARFNGGGVGYVTFDGVGNLYVSDTGNQIVRKVSVNSQFPATATGSSISQTLQVHFDSTNLPAATTPFKITSASADFVVNGTPTCSNNTTKLDTSLDCYVSVSFKPLLTGSRTALLQATTVNGSVYNFPLSGFANGSQIAIDGGSPTVISPATVGSIAAVATDSLGNVYMADPTNNRVILQPAGGLTANSTVGTNLKGPLGVAVDAQGNVFISDSGNNQVVKVTPDNVQTTLTTDVKTPQGLAVDANGNLYVADTGNARIVEISPFGDLGPSGLLTFSGAQALVTPVAVTVDKNGNVFIADSGNSSGLIELLPGGGDLQAQGSGPSTSIVGFGSGFVKSPSGVAVDGAGNLYVSDSIGNSILEVPASTGPGSEPFKLNFPGLNGPTGVALDYAGNLYVADTNNNRVLYDNRTNLAVDFGKVYVHQTPGSANLTVTNIGSSSYAPTSPFSVVSGTNASEYAANDTCTADRFPLGTLGSGLHCSLTPTFTPTDIGTRTASISVQGGIASISLTGVGFLPQASLNLGVAAPGGLVAGQNATVTLTVTQPSAKNTPSGGPVTFSYTVNGVLTTLAPMTLPANGMITFQLPTLLLGRQYSVNATYGGDAFDSGASASPLNFYVPGRQVTVVANSLSYVYGSPVPQPVGVVTGILPADQATVKYTLSSAATPSSPVGVYPITVIFTGGNYQDYGSPSVVNADLKTPATITETKAPLTVTIANATSTYGRLTPNFTHTDVGLVNGDKTSLKYVPVDSQKFDPGTYTIVPTVSIPSGTAYDNIQNYNLTVVNGTLIINPATPVITVTQPLKAVLPTALASSTLTFLTAQPDPMHQYGTPTGTLTLNDTFTPITPTGTGPPVNEPALTLTLDAKGIATYAPTDPTLGTHVYAVTYNGDKDFSTAATTATPTTLIVDVPDFTITSTTSPIQVVPGIPAGGNPVTGGQAATPETAVIFITPILGTTQVVNLTCTVPTSYLTCSIAPNVITLAGATVQQAVISLSTPGTLPINYFAQVAKPSAGNIVLAFLPLGLLGLLPLLRGKNRIRATRLLILVTGVVLALGASGCGGNLVQFFTPVPAGPQDVVITGTSGSITRSFTVTASVQ